MATANRTVADLRDEIADRHRIAEETKQFTVQLTDQLEQRKAELERAKTEAKTYKEKLEKFQEVSIFDTVKLDHESMGMGKDGWESAQNGIRVPYIEDAAFRV